VAVRLAEIDAPEKAQPFGRRSKEALSDLCYMAPATIKPTATDRYGRTVARVECRGKDANAEQVRAGMAWAYTRYQIDPVFTQLEQRARAARVGLWRDAEPVPPWEWRAERRATAAMH
jgi:endonuclease YncB( thermonuclease family)